MAFAEKKGNKASYSVSCIAFYNLENLFDTINDPAINDEEYLPDGPNKWNSLKYNSKLENMAYAISKIGLDVSPVGPVILGVAEIENRGVLEDLVKQPAIKDRNYQIVHYDSPDRRGVDVGLLYNPDYFTVTNTASHRLHVPENPEPPPITWTSGSWAILPISPAVSGQAAMTTSPCMTAAPAPITAVLPSIRISGGRL